MEQKETERETQKKRIKAAFAKINIKQCKTCKRFINEREYKAGEGSCFKCWEA